MRYTTETNWKPGWTPSTIRNLIIITVIVSVACGLLQNIYLYFFDYPGPQEYFALSWWGLTQFYFWQPISYLFVQDGGSQGISLWFMISLLFQMYVLWAIGSIVYEHLTQKTFLAFYFITGVLAGLMALLIAQAEGTAVFLAGPIAPLMGLLTLWTMLHPEGEIYLFFLIPIRAKWLLVGILGTFVLIAFSQVNFVYVTLYIVGALSGYLYGVLGRDLRGPFASWYGFEDHLIDYFTRFQNLVFRTKKVPPKSKIYDFETGNPVNDDDDKFVDAMLDKISKHGEKSLSWNERRRMQKISEKKKKG